MTQPGGSAKERSLLGVELRTDWPAAWPGASVAISLIGTREEDLRSDSIIVSLATLEGETVTQAVPHNGIAALEIPHDCPCGDYLLCVSLDTAQEDQLSDSLPFEITSRRVAEFMRHGYEAAALQAEALAVAEHPTGSTEEAMRLADLAEDHYTQSGEARLARKTWEDISDALRHRGLLHSAREAAARARALEPKPQVAYAAEPARRLAKPEVARLYEHFAPQLRFFLAKQSRLQHRVEDLLADTFMCLLRYPPVEKLARADSYLWRIAWRLVNAENRRAQHDKVQLARLTNDAPGWLLGQSSTLSPTDTAEWLAYREQVRQSLEGLEPEERQAVLLARMGYSYKDIAARLGVSVASLHEYLRRGYAKLKASRAPEET